MFPERFSNLPAYAFPRLRALLDHHAPGGDVVHMTIGEPKHAFPEWVTQIITENADGFNSYPDNNGLPVLLEAAQNWLKRRFDADVTPEQIIALNGTREGLYNAQMALCPEQKNGGKPVILIPNPFYQVYMIGAMSVNAEQVFLPATAQNNHLPDYAGLPTDVLDRTAIAFVCSPSNPQGAVATKAYLQELIELGEKHDFQIFSDECYSEIYRDDAPTSTLKVAQDMGAHPERVVVFHSLSKRSNLPGLRSGFAAGGPESIAKMRQLRAFSGAPLPNPLQIAAAAVWNDETHVTQNRAMYQEKYRIADEIFGSVQGYAGPEAGFFLWLPVEDGEQAALKLWRETGVRVLPGEYLSKDGVGINPGKSYIRAAMVAPKDEMAQGLIRLRDCLYTK